MVGRAAHLLRFCPSIRLRRAPRASLVSASRSSWFSGTGTEQLCVISREPSPLDLGHFILFFSPLFPFFQTLPSPGPAQRGDVAPAILGLLPVVPSAHNLPQTCVTPATFPAALESSSPQPAFLHLPQHLCMGTSTTHPSGKL